MKGRIESKCAQMIGFCDVGALYLFRYTCVVYELPFLDNSVQMLSHILAVSIVRWPLTSECCLRTTEMPTNECSYNHER